MWKVYVASANIRLLKVKWLFYVVIIFYKYMFKCGTTLF